MLCKGDFLWRCPYPVRRNHKRPACGVLCSDACDLSHFIIRQEAVKTVAVGEQHRWAARIDSEIDHRAQGGEVNGAGPGKGCGNGCNGTSERRADS